MAPALMLPRLVFGDGALGHLGEELALMGVSRPFLISDRGLAGAGLVQEIRDTTPIAGEFLAVPENPTAAAVDAAAAAFGDAGCDGVVALGGGSVIDTAKMVAAAVRCARPASELVGRPDRIFDVAPLVAIPTTVGTGSESSPVAALHVAQGEPAIGTRGPLMVPRVALCDPMLARSLPPKMIAATAVDALSHCLEGFFVEPPHPIIDALALDGAARVLADVHAALTPDGDAARASLMAAAFAGGAAIHKGLGPAHAVALACGDQHVHHGMLIGMALPHSVRLLARELPAKGRALREALGLPPGADLGESIGALIHALGLPTTLDGTGYRSQDAEQTIAAMIASPFNRTSPYNPTEREYRAIAEAIGVG